MPPVGPEFGRLHQLLQDLQKIQDQLTKGPRQIKARQNRVVQETEKLQTKEEELKAARAESDRKNLDLKSKESKITDLKQKLNTAASNREYEIISGQIEADQAAQAVLEDEFLEWMERVDELQSEIADLKAGIAEANENVRQFANEFEEKAAGLHDEETALQLEIREAEKVIPTEIRPQYRRLVEAYGPDALSDCGNGVCNHCFVQLTPQSKVMLNSGKTLFCGSCGRLLYQSDSQA